MLNFNSAATLNNKSVTPRLRNTDLDDINGIIVLSVDSLDVVPCQVCCRMLKYSKRKKGFDKKTSKETFILHVIIHNIITICNYDVWFSRNNKF